jgi:N-terminal domain of anti-restriction factor ArdC
LSASGKEGKGFPSHKTILTEENRKGGEQQPMTQLQQQLKTLAHWRGSAKTADAVREEIARRWGDAEAKQYNPLTNCFTIQTWNKLGYRVKKGEKAIRSITYVEGKDQAETSTEEEEQDVRTYPKTVYLFYRTQVEKR